MLDVLVRTASTNEFPIPPALDTLLGKASVSQSPGDLAAWAYMGLQLQMSWPQISEALDTDDRDRFQLAEQRIEEITEKLLELERHPSQFPLRIRSLRSLRRFCAAGLASDAWMRSPDAIRMAVRRTQPIWDAAQRAGVGGR